MTESGTTEETSPALVLAPVPLRARLTDEQKDRLLNPINPSRIQALNNNAYLAQHDVRAHMNRIFGFGGWSMEVLDLTQLYEMEKQTKAGASAWEVGYRATVKVTIYSAIDGSVIAHYTDANADYNLQPNRAEANKVALTSAVSTAFKRACTNLGDQFGLSLYQKDARKQRIRFVAGTLFDSEAEQTRRREEAAKRDAGENGQAPTDAIDGTAVVGLGIEDHAENPEAPSRPTEDPEREVYIAPPPEPEEVETVEAILADLAEAAATKKPERLALISPLLQRVIASKLGDTQVTWEGKNVKLRTALDSVVKAP